MNTPFNMTVDEIIEHASDSLGGGVYTGDALRKARLDLQLVIVDMLNHSVPLSLIRQVTFNSSSNTYTFDPEVKDVVDIVDSTDSIRTRINQIDLLGFNHLNSNNTPGRPTIWATHKKETGTDILFYPDPDKEYTYTAYVEIDPSRIEYYDQTLELRSYFLPAIIAGLVFYMMKRDPSTSENKLLIAKQYYDEQLEVSINSDRDKAPLFIRPTRFRRY